MFRKFRALVALSLAALLLGSGAVPASAGGYLGPAIQLVKPAAVSVPYGSGPIVIDPLATAVVLPGQHILPGNTFNGVFDLNDAITGYGKGETDASAIAPAFVKNLAQPGDFIGTVNLIDAGADIYALHQKDRLRVIVMPYDGFSGTLNLDYAGKIVDSAGNLVYAFTNVPITATVQDPTVKAVDDTATGPLFADGSISADNGLTASGGSLTIPNVFANDTFNYPGRTRSAYLGAKGNTQTAVGIPEGVVYFSPNYSGEATFYAYDPKFTGKTTPVPYTECSSYAINPRGYLDVGYGIDNTSTSEVCSTALLTFDVPAVVPDGSTIPQTPVKAPETPVVPVKAPQTPVVPVKAPQTPAKAPDTPAQSLALKLHIADGSAAAPAVVSPAASPAVPVPAVLGIAALLMAVIAGGLIAVRKARRK